MMLHYKTIYQANKTARRLQKGRYGGYYGKEHTRDGDTLALFTVEPVAEKESLDNLERIMSVARDHGQKLVVFKPNQVQVAGHHDLSGRGGSQVVANRLFPEIWLEDHRVWLDSSNTQRPTFQVSQSGECMEFYSWRNCLAWRGHQGVYDVDTGRRLTNRRDIIERMWALGFAAHRGRPLSLARLRWTGEREELTELTELAERHWPRANRSEVAKKIVSAFTSINRYAAWPGSW